MSCITTNSFQVSRDLADINYRVRHLGCQISPLVLGIQDDGPAILDGEYARLSTAGLLADAAAAGRGKFSSRLGRSLQVSFSSFAGWTGWSKRMIIASLMLSFSLLCLSAYALQQRQQVNQLEAELLLLQSAEADR